MELKFDEKNCLKNDLIIPVGYRLLEDWEVLKELRNNKELKKLLISSYVWCNNYKNNIRVAFFGCSNGDFRIGGNYNLNINGYSRGVFVKEIQEMKDNIFSNDDLLSQWLKDSIEDRLPLILEQLQKELLAEITIKFNTHHILKHYIPIIAMYVKNVFGKLMEKTCNCPDDKIVHV